jgi:hypothetical protein
VREEHEGGREYLSDLWLAQVGRIQVEADDAGCESHAAALLIAGTLPGSGVCPKTSPSIHTHLLLICFQQFYMTSYTLVASETYTCPPVGPLLCNCRKSPV